jgi:hypothetical protein
VSATEVITRAPQVFVDGYLVGTVDRSDGVFQRLNVEAGSHKIELRADGYEQTQFDIQRVERDERVTRRATAAAVAANPKRGKRLIY